MFILNYLDIDGLIKSCWNGAEDFVRDIKDLGKGEELMDLLNEAFISETPTLEGVNDFLIEEEDYIAGVLGIDQDEL